MRTWSDLLSNPLSDRQLIDLQDSQLWDFAGVDGLQFAKHLLGESVDRIAPFQSLETSLDSYSCSLLRLCENNFRLRFSGNDARARESAREKGAELEQKMRSLQVGLQVWVKPLIWMAGLALPEAIAASRLLQLVTPKPPHRLEGLQPNCAVPGRLDERAVLVWRHSISGQPVFELHAATKDIQIIQAQLIC